MRFASYPDPQRSSIRDATEDVRRQPYRLPSFLQPVPPVPDVDGFPRGVLRERALLAVTDDIGETRARYPMDAVRGRQILLTLAEREPERSAVIIRDDQDLLERLGGDPSRQSGRVPCPAHGGKDRNLAWRWGDRGRLLLTCFSHHCTFDEIVEAVR